MAKKPVYGIGINDVDYIVQATVNGKVIICPYYSKWKGVLERCYSKKLQTKHPTYVGCTIHKEWVYFSKFKAWMETQDWQGKELDKDLLFRGNKVYCPDTVVFVNALTNSFLVNGGAQRGEYLLGVHFHKKNKVFVAQCHNPFTKMRGYIGCFKTEIEAHKAWQEEKHNLANRLADLQEDPRVAEALRQRYAPDKDWTKT